MTPLYLNPPPPSPFPLVEELKAELVDQNLNLYLSPPPPPSNFFNTTVTHQDQRVLSVKPAQEPKPHDYKVIKLIMNSHEGSSSTDQQASSSSSSSLHESPMHEDHHSAAIHGGGHKLTLARKEEEDGDHYESASDNNDGSTVKWMSSKMRLMKKMMNNNSNCGGSGGGGGGSGAADHNMNSSNKLPLKIRHKFHQYQMHDSDEITNNNNNNSFMSKSIINNNTTTVRVCSDCNTTTTPLWRSGPRGPKSLCNACGIRQRKARRAMEAAAAAGNGEAAVATDNTTTAAAAAAASSGNGMKIKVHINKEIKKGRINGQYKNKQSAAAQSQKKVICFKEFALSLSKNSSSALQRVFPQDVEDAAILLMELSCGLVHS